MNIFSSSRSNRTHSGQRTTGHAGAHRPRAANEGRNSADGAENISENGLAVSLFAALFALPVAAVIGFILLLIVTMVACANADPDALTTPLALAALGLTSLMGGMVAAIRGYRHPLLSAVIFGLFLILLQLAGLLFYSDELRAQLSMGVPALGRWGMRLSVLPFSLLGGGIGKKRDRVRHHTHGHHS